MTEEETEALVFKTVQDSVESNEVPDAIVNDLVPKVATYLHENAMVDFDDLPEEHIPDALRRVEDVAYHCFWLLFELSSQVQ